MMFVDGSLAADGRSYRSRDPFGEYNQFRFRCGDDDTAAANKNRPGRRAQQLSGVLDRIHVGCSALGRIAAELCLAPNLGAIHETVLHVEGESDMRRTGAAG